MKFRLVEEKRIEKRLRKKRKNNKGLSPFSYLNPNAGNVEHNVNMFNNSSDTLNANLSSSGISEDLQNLLVEDIDAVRRQFPYIDQFDFDEIINLDPTYNPDKNSVGKYGKWLLSLYRKDNPLNHNGVKNLLAEYDRLKNDRKYSIEKDINRIRNIQELENAVKNVDTTELSDRQKERELRTSKHYKEVYRDNDWTIYIPTTFAGSCTLGKGTEWCTAYSYDDIYFRGYTNQGPLYILISNKNPKEKYQFHFESDQFMDRYDEEINVNEFFDKYPKVETFFFPNRKNLGKISLKNYEVTLLSIKEYRKFKDYIPLVDTVAWWLRSRGNYFNFAACVYSGGSVDVFGHNVDYVDISVRPALISDDLKSFDLNPEDRFKFLGNIWVYLGDGYAISRDSIGQHRFDEESNNWENSELKQWLDNWVNEQEYMYSDVIDESYKEPSYTFKYEGPVYRFEKVYDKKCKPVYTDAKTKKQAENFIKGKLKDIYGFSMSAKLDIDGNKVEKLHDSEGYEKEIGRMETQKIVFPEEEIIDELAGRTIYFHDGYYYVEGSDQPFICMSDIYDYLGEE